MKIAVDTNILVRAVTQDDLTQTPVAEQVLTDAELVVLTTSALCELVWVLSRVYRIPAIDIAEMIRTLLAGDNVTADMPVVEAGLAMLDKGGDFADGVIAYEGRWQGAETFVSFDRKAVRLLEAGGEKAHLLA